MATPACEGWELQSSSRAQLHARSSTAIKGERARPGDSLGAALLASRILGTDPGGPSSRFRSQFLPRWELAHSQASREPPAAAMG